MKILQALLHFNMTENEIVFSQKCVTFHLLKLLDIGHNDMPVGENIFRFIFGYHILSWIYLFTCKSLKFNYRQKYDIYF